MSGFREQEVNISIKGKDVIEVTSLDDLGDLEDSRSLLASEEPTTGEILREQALKIIEGLDERERTVLARRFGLFDGRPHTLEQIAKEINRSPSTVRRIENRALFKTRNPDKTPPTLH